MNFLLSPRLKSFYWRTGMMALASFLAIVADSLNMLELSPQITVVIGLVLGEISKALTNAVDNKPLGFAKIG